MDGFHNNRAYRRWAKETVLFIVLLLCCVSSGITEPFPPCIEYAVAECLLSYLEGQVIQINAQNSQFSI